jgi:hypothetical protein
MNSEQYIQNLKSKISLRELQRTIDPVMLSKAPA